jgi:hypothetical protein
MVLVGFSFREQFRQPRDIHGDPSRLVFREHPRLSRLVLVLPRVNVRERLPVGVPDDIAAGHLVGAPGCGKRRGVIGGEEGEATGRGMASTSLA